MGWVITAFIVGMLWGHGAGWIYAHKTVAYECEKLDAFYVGKKVFRCTAVEDRND
ncbi:hypothetical protein [Delftia acidovorans]|uniref:Uncharacterized protein n=1 Tax=Delftia acidovorans TaxID=80866 RepID=A0AAJ2R8E8_DELAC|nr:hypothetical protein [Delftia acidovorans]MDX4957898.1 hypothetical protein [Delftia acidovorans]